MIEIDPIKYDGQPTREAYDNDFVQLRKVHDALTALQAVVDEAQKRIWTHEAESFFDEYYSHIVDMTRDCQFAMKQVDR